MDKNQATLENVLSDVNQIIKKLRDYQRRAKLSGQFRLGLEHIIAMNIDASHELRANPSSKLQVLSAQCLRNNLESILSFLELEIERQSQLDKLVSLEPRVLNNTMLA
jgi:hypothetical protein